MFTTDLASGILKIG